MFVSIWQRFHLFKLQSTNRGTCEFPFFLEESATYYYQVSMVIERSLNVLLRGVQIIGECDVKMNRSKDSVQNQVNDSVRSYISS